MICQIWQLKLLECRYLVSKFGSKCHICPSIQQNNTSLQVATPCCTNQCCESILNTNKRKKHINKFKKFRCGFQSRPQLVNMLILRTIRRNGFLSGLSPWTAFSQSIAHHIFWTIIFWKKRNFYRLTLFKPTAAAPTLRLRNFLVKILNSQSGLTAKGPAKLSG